MFRPRAGKQQFAAGDGAGAGHRARLDTVGNRLPAHAVQRAHAFNDDGGCTRAAHARAHRVQKRRQIDDFRFLGRVFDARRAAGQCRRHQQVFRRADGRHIQIDDRPAQAARKRHTAVVKLHLCAQRAHALEVLVDGPLADRAAAGQGNARFAQPREQRAEHQHRGAHLAYILFVLRVLQRGGVQNERVVLLFHAAPARGQQRAERLHIRQFRHAFNARVFARQQRAAHDGQHRVLGCADGYFSPQRRAFANRIMRHENPSDFFRLCGGEPA